MSLSDFFTKIGLSAFVTSNNKKIHNQQKGSVNITKNHNAQQLSNNAKNPQPASVATQNKQSNIQQERKIYKWTQRDMMGEFTKYYYEHQAQTEIRCIRMTKNPQLREQTLNETLNKWKQQGFVEKPYTGCEGFKRTCKNPPAPGSVYCSSCLQSMNEHIAGGEGSCNDCPIGGCAKPLTFPCAAQKK